MPSSGAVTTISSMETTRESAELGELIDDGQPLVAVFVARWSPAARLVEHISRDECARRSIRILVVDVDSAPQLADQHRIFGVPTVLGFNHGREYGRLVGAMGRTEIEEVFTEMKKGS